MPVSGHPPYSTSQLHHHLLRACRPGKVVLGNQQIALLCDAWRVAKPRSDDMQRELALEFRLSASAHRMEKSWPTRNAGAAKQSRHFAA
jgi:hypothetical protein